MSGAEVAGLVLGSIPLLVSGLEHYGEGVRTISKMRNSAKEFAKLKQALECEQHMFLNCLEILLKDDVDDQVFAELLGNASDKNKWSDPSIDRCLQRRLGRSYGAYRDTAKHMGSSIQEFRDSLQLGKDGKGPFTVDRRSVSVALKSIKFGLKMRAYAEMMEEISSHNKRLCQLTDQSRILAPVTVTRRRIPDFEKARKHADEIFVTLQQALVGSCNVGHQASLYMRPVESTGAKRLTTGDLNRFRIVLHHHTTKTGATSLKPPWLIEEAEIRAIEDDPDEARQIDGRPSGSVRFRVAPRPGSNSRQDGSQAVPEIKDLCISLQQLRALQSKCDVCLGYLSGMAKGCRHELYWPDRPLVDQKSSTTLSLAEILDNSQGHRLAESDKRYLALALASGMLRLYDTPWLARQWGKKEVLLFQRRGGIVAAHPFISAEIPVDSQQTSTSAGLPPYFTSCRLIKEETVFALGIMLIELAMEKPFEALRTADDLNPDGSKHQLSDYCTADRLVDEVFAVAGERYANVVRRCIQCQFDEQKINLGSAPFRRKFYEGVVMELEMELEDLNSL